MSRGLGRPLVGRTDGSCSEQGSEPDRKSESAHLSW